MTTPNQKLSYFLSEKKGVLIVSLIGALHRDNQPTFEQCVREVSASHAKWIIVNFRDVQKEIDPSYFPVLSRLQQSVRERPAELRISGLHPKLRESLESQGIVAPGEVANNLNEALNMITQLLTRAA